MHFLSCSPWQIADYPTQLMMKHELLERLFGYHGDIPSPDLVPADHLSGYRTKMEFSFDDHDGPLALAFHERGGGSGRPRAENGCMLASDRMNAVAVAVTEAIRRAGVASRDLKTLVVRESKSEGSVIAVLYAKAESLPPFDLVQIPDLAGVLVFHSSPRSPASVPTRLLSSFGNNSLADTILGKRFQYSWDSFFQNNIPMFERALSDIIGAVPPGARVVEYYAGVGTIGLSIAQKVREVVMTEIVPSAVARIRENAEALGIRNIAAHEGSAERMLDLPLGSDDVLVLDPPRAGLHPKLIARILDASPSTIIYLSCNPETQARDYSVLRDRYAVSLARGYDFYPNTPHVEHLLVLNRQEN
jgi:23S rRNA (uracil1939-C5)-methyltransferase